MTLAWKSDFAAGKKMVLLALCDNANEQGECFPSISMLASKCSMSERSVFTHVASLESDGAVKRENRPGRSTVYHLDPRNFFSSTTAEIAPLLLQISHPTPADFSPTPASLSPAPLQPFHPTPAAVAPITINESSIETSMNPKESKKNIACAFAIPDVHVDVLADFLAIRKAKRAPLTETALKGLRREADKAGVALSEALAICCERGWQSFKAEWIVDKAQRGTPAQPINRQIALEARNRAVAAEWMAMQGDGHATV